MESGKLAFAARGGAPGGGVTRAKPGPPARADRGREIERACVTGLEVPEQPALAFPGVRLDDRLALGRAHSILALVGILLVGLDAVGLVVDLLQIARELDHRHLPPVRLANLLERQRRAQ